MLVCNNISLCRLKSLSTFLPQCHKWVDKLSNVHLPAFMWQISLEMFHWEGWCWKEMKLCLSLTGHSDPSLLDLRLSQTVFCSLSVLFTFPPPPRSSLCFLPPPRLSSSLLASFVGQKMSKLLGLIWGIQAAVDRDRGWQKGQLFHNDKRLCSCLRSDTIQLDL